MTKEELYSYIYRVEDKLLRSKNFQEQLSLHEYLQRLRLQYSKLSRES